MQGGAGISSPWRCSLVRRVSRYRSRRYGRDFTRQSRGSWSAATRDHPVSADDFARSCVVLGGVLLGFIGFISELDGP